MEFECMERALCHLSVQYIVITFDDPRQQSRKIGDVALWPEQQCLFSRPKFSEAYKGARLNNGGRL